MLGIFSGFIAPLVIFLIKRDSKFVSFHALQSLAWHIIYFVLVFGGMTFLFVSLIFSSGFPPSNGAPPLALFGIFGFVWLFAMGGWVVNLILGIVYGIKANKGEWAQFPLIGGWILRKVIFT